MDSGTNKMRTDMKKTFKFFAAALAIVAAASCAKELANDATQTPEAEQELVHKVFSASLNVDPETKTTLHTDGVTVHWTEGDRIAVIPAGSSSANNFSVVSIDGTFADFEGETVDADSYRAVYPAAAFHGWSTASTFTFSNGEYALKNQYAVENDFSVAAAFNCSSNFAVSTTSKDEHLYFQNINAYLKVSLEMDNAAVIEVSTDKVAGSSGLTTAYDLGGSLNYKVATGEVYMSSNHSIVFKSEDGSNLKPGVNYYIAIPTVKMSGLTMTVKDADGEALVAFTKTAEFTPVANTIYNLGKMAAPETDINPDFSASHVFENNILTGTKVTMTLPADEVSKISNVKVQIKNGSTVYRSFEKSTISTSEVLSVYDNNLYLPKGSYEAVMTYTISGLTKSMTAYLTVPQVSGLTVSATKTPYTSYSKYKEGLIPEANNLNGKSLYNIGYTVNISQEILNKTPLSEARIRIVASNYIDKDGSKTSKDFYTSSEISNLAFGQCRTVQAIATFDGVQFFMVHNLTNCYITGLPFKPSVSELGFTSLSGTTSREYTPSVNLPSSTNVSVNTNVELASTRKYTGIPIYTYNVHTFKIAVGDNSNSASSNSGNTNTVSKSLSLATTMNGPSTKVNMSVSEGKQDYDDPTCYIKGFEIIYR